jgi:3-oxoacyl-[acyl-carrier protein] reductase
MTFDLKRKSSLIIGGTSNLGVAIGKALAKAGAEVSLAGRDNSKLLKCSREIGIEPPSLSFDLQSQSQIQEAISGLNTLPDIVVHAQGGNLGIHEAMAETKDWEKVFQLNFFSIIQINRILMERYSESDKSATIIHISSSSAVHGKGAAPYGAAKAALNHYVRKLGEKYAPRGFNMTGIMPTPIEGKDNNWAKAKVSNPKHYEEVKNSQTLKRFTSPEEIAQACLFLCSPAGILFSGNVLSADSSIR